LFLIVNVLILKQLLSSVQISVAVWDIRTLPLLPYSEGNVIDSIFMSTWAAFSHLAAPITQRKGS